VEAVGLEPTGASAGQPRPDHPPPLGSKAALAARLSILGIRHHHVVMYHLPFSPRGGIILRLILPRLPRAGVSVSSHGRSGNLIAIV
jgi:hypothetical protein